MLYYSFMNKIFLIISLFLGALSAGAQGEKGFVIKGEVGLPDGYSVTLCCQTDTAFSVRIADGWIKDGRFELKGHLNHPLPGTLMTNNLDLVNKNHWPNDSIHWTYTDVFISNDEIFVDKNLKVTGGLVQTDFNEFKSLSANGKEETAVWSFIDSHPNSVISVYLANNLLKRGYNLTSGQVQHLEQAIADILEDSLRMDEFRKRIAFAKKTTKGGELVDLELQDVNGKICHLIDIVPRNQYVLVDFWASWCGPCRMLAPVIAEIAEEKADVLKVGKVNVDDEGALASRYGIISIPTVILFKNGQIAAKSIGYKPKEEILALL